MEEESAETYLIAREASRWRAGEIGDVEFRAYVDEILVAVRQMEAERCARVCESVGPKDGPLKLVSDGFAAAIRKG